MTAAPSTKLSILSNSINFLAFNDLYPKAPLHILIIPKVHIESFQDVSPTIMAGLTPFIQRVATKLGLDKSGYRLITNILSDGGQEVPHLHFHIFGGEKIGRMVS